MRNIDDYAILIVPGFGGSGTEHWQTAWEQAFPGFERVQQADWDHPDYTQWSERLSNAVARSTRPVVLVAHSLGTSLTMRWGFDQSALARKIAGAFLVAPTDRDRFDALPDSPTRGFGRMLLARLAFPSMVVASRDDDRVSYERATAFAAAWGSTLIDAGNLGHMGSAAKLGLWPFGLICFGRFLALIEVEQSPLRDSFRA
jgi:predicted alpha/beta hydrolase family esterase